MTAVARLRRQALQSRRFDVGDDPLGVQRGREAPAGAYQALGQLARADAHQDTLARLPHIADSLVLAIVAHLLFDAVGGAAQRQLAQRDEIALAEEVLDRRPRLLRHVDLALVQAIDQLVGRQIDQLHLVGTVEHRVGHRLVDTNSGDAADHVVQALQVLDVERGVDVDASVEQLLDVVPALGMARAFGVRVSQLVDEDDCGAPFQGCIEIEFLDAGATVFDDPGREDFQAVEQGGGVRAVMGLDDTHDHVDALGALLARGEEHRVGLADAGGRAEEDLQPPTALPGFLALDARQERVRIPARVVAHRVIIESEPGVFRASRPG